MSQLFLDLRHGARVLLRQPGATAAAVVTLALGIGATSAIFTVLDAVVLRPLDYRHAERLGVLWVDFGEQGQSLPAISAADFRDLRETTHSFEGLAAGTGMTANLTGEGDPELVDLGAVTHDFFSLLGVEPTLGRGFLPEEDVPNGPAVAMLGHGIWQRRFGGDPGVVGRSVELNGTAHQVVGVLPSDFELLLPSEAVFLRDSAVWSPLQETYDGPRNRTLLTALARLEEGVTFEQAGRELEAAAARLREAHPVHQRSDTRIRVVPLHLDVVKDVRAGLLALFAAAALVLLIACGNVAGLLLARATARRREIAIRCALGASRGRIVRQLVTESVLLALAGAAAGLVLAHLSTGLLRFLEPSRLPRLASVEIDLSALAFAAVSCLGTVLLFGIAPAVRASRSEPTASIGTGRSPSVDRQSLRRAVVVGQVALSLVLLIGVGLLTRSFVRLREVRPGFDAANVLTFRVSLPASRYAPADRVRFFEHLEERLGALPGVRSVGSVSQLPLGGRTSQVPYAYDAETAEHWESVTADARTVTPGLFRALGFRLAAGRSFDERDTASGMRVAIVDELLAARAWPGASALGKQVQLPVFGPGGVTREWHEVIGVVGHARLHDLARDVREQVYLPQAQGSGRAMDVVVRGATDLAALASLIPGEVHALDEDLPVHDLRPMSDYVSAALARSRFTVMLSSAFGAIALLLAAVGLYGVVSYAVGQRRREYGIRLALGADGRGILRLVVGEGARLVLLGLAVGLAAALVTGRALSGMLYGVGATDALTFLAVPGLLTGVALLACYLPARRAIRTDPAVILRDE